MQLLLHNYYLQSSHLSIAGVLNSSAVCRVSGSDGSLRDTLEKETRKSRSVEPRAAEKKRSSLLLAERGGEVLKQLHVYMRSVAIE